MWGGCRSEYEIKTISKWQTPKNALPVYEGTTYFDRVAESSSVHSRLTIKISLHYKSWAALGNFSTFWSSPFFEGLDTNIFAEG
jgi:hypothetical protein